MYSLIFVQHLRQALVCRQHSRRADAMSCKICQNSIIYLQSCLVLPFFLSAISQSAVLCTFLWGGGSFIFNYLAGDSYQNWNNPAALHRVCVCACLCCLSYLDTASLQSQRKEVRCSGCLYREIGRSKSVLSSGCRQEGRMEGLLLWGGNSWKSGLCILTYSMCCWSALQVRFVLRITVSIILPAAVQQFETILNWCHLMN